MYLNRHQDWEIIDLMLIMLVKKMKKSKKLLEN
jgi:hypothetical protein